MSAKRSDNILTKLGTALNHVRHGLQYLLELFATGVYRMMLERNTIQPLRDIVKAKNIETQRTLLCRWAQIKANECSYIQLAGGFLFTTVASCLQWQSTQDGHWCASALFYVSILVALVAVVMASQQMLVLPNRTLNDSHEATVAVISSNLPQQQVPPALPISDTEIEERENKDLDAMINRLCLTHHSGKPNWLHVFALQAPIMLLTLATLSFFAGVCAVVFAPLAQNFVWGDEAKIAIFVAATGLFLIFVFCPTSLLLHGLFSVHEDQTSKFSLYLARIKS